jgi:hypothetical protein
MNFFLNIGSVSSGYSRHADQMGSSSRAKHDLFISLRR